LLQGGQHDATSIDDESADATKDSTTDVYVGGRDDEEFRHGMRHQQLHMPAGAVSHGGGAAGGEATIREEKDRSSEIGEASATSAVAAETPDHHLNQTLLKWKSQCFVNMRLHRKSYYHFKRIYDMLSYPIMILAAVTSGSVLGSETQAVRYSSATLSLIIIVLTSVIRHVRPAEAAQQHEHFSRKFEVLLQTLQSVVGSPLSAASMKERDDFVTELRTKLDELVTSRLPPPSRVIRDYEARHGPVDGILYGEDMVSVLVNQARTAHLINAIQRVAKGDDRVSSNREARVRHGAASAPSFDFRKKILNFDRDALKRMMGQRDRTGYDDARRGGAISRFFDWMYSGNTFRRGRKDEEGEIRAAARV